MKGITTEQAMKMAGNLQFTGEKQNEVIVYP